MTQMLTKRWLALAALLPAMWAATPAEAFHPFEQNYGYVMPERLRKDRRSERGLETPITGEGRRLTRDRDQALVDLTSRARRADRAGRSKRIKVAAVAPPTVHFGGRYAPGSIVIDTAGRSLYYVKGGGQAYKYPVAVGRKGFTWSGSKTITRKADWPDWRPPAEMRARQRGLPKVMKGGVNNPLGAKALYLGNSLYRIHGTNDVKSIGTAASSGCIRMTNEHVTHLSEIAGVGTKVHVVKKLSPKLVAAAN